MHTHQCSVRPYIPFPPQSLLQALAQHTAAFLCAVDGLSAAASWRTSVFYFIFLVGLLGRRVSRVKRAMFSFSAVLGSFEHRSSNMFVKSWRGVVLRSDTCIF